MINQNKKDNGISKSKAVSERENKEAEVIVK